VKVPFKARTQAEPPAPQGESGTWASVGQTVSPATDFHHRLLVQVGQTIAFCRLPAAQATENDGLRHDQPARIVRR
jgi:hypothetical protein